MISPQPRILHFERKSKSGSSLKEEEEKVVEKRTEREHREAAEKREGERENRKGRVERGRRKRRGICRSGDGGARGIRSIVTNSPRIF